jgi:tRNA (guanine-N7-)-methyltransferase
MKRKPNLEARIEKCARLLVKEPELFRGCWLDFFGYRELRVELGCGKGGFLVKAAKDEPDVFFVAIEKSANVLVIALERTVDAELQNVRFINAFAEDLLSYFASAEISCIYINFCDPWPSNRHVKRRLTGSRFLEIYRQLLGHDGQLRFKTDSLQLFKFSLREFSRFGFDLLEVVHDLYRTVPVGIMTDYEQKFYDQGIPIFQCIACPASEALERNREA